MENIAFNTMPKELAEEFQRKANYAKEQFQVAMEYVGNFVEEVKHLNPDVNFEERFADTTHQIISFNVDVCTSMLVLPSGYRYEDDGVMTSLKAEVNGYVVDFSFDLDLLEVE